MSKQTLVERLEAASWSEALRADANRALESGAPSYIVEEIEAVARLCGEAVTALARMQKDLDCAQENFHVTNQAYVKADTALTQAQARCAEARSAALEEAAKLFEPSCMCPEPCEEYFIWPGGCEKKAASMIRALKAPR